MGRRPCLYTTSTGICIVYRHDFRPISNGSLPQFLLCPFWVLWCFVHVCFVQVTIFKLVWRSCRADAPRGAHFPTGICSVIQEVEITVEKCANEACQRVGSATLCHLDETNMDITTVHPILRNHLQFLTLCIQSINTWDRTLFHILFMEEFPNMSSKI